jgi:hypothetical protein
VNDDSAIDQLAKRFEALGAPDPAGWAASQVREGIPQLARYLFLRQAWRSIVADGDSTWIAADRAAAAQDPSAPYAGVGMALERLKDAGASDRDLSDLVRGKQAELLFSLCYLLEDPAVEEPEGQDVLWALVQITEAGEIVGPMSGLHESVLETDPTGREMRPRGDQG